MRQLSLVPSQSSPTRESERDAYCRVDRAIRDAWLATPEGAALDSAFHAVNQSWGAASVAVAEALKPYDRRLASARRVAKNRTDADREAALLVVDHLTAARAVTHASASEPLITATRKRDEAIVAMYTSRAAFWAERAADFR